jgi:cytochrome P450
MAVRNREFDGDFDHLDPELSSVMNEALSALRDRCAVARSELYDGFWAALSYGAVRTAASDAQTYSSTGSTFIPPVKVDIQVAPSDYDPPEHTEFRKIIQKFFTRSGVAAVEAPLRSLVRARLVELAAAGKSDFVPGLGRYAPPLAIALAMGLPPEDGEKFVNWTTEMLSSAMAGDFSTNRRISKVMLDYAAQQLDARRDDGESAVITAIANGRVAGRPLTPTEKVGMIRGLVLAGNESAANSISTMLYHIATVAGLRERLIERPELIPSMIDESLRLESPLIGIGRTVVADTTLAGQSLRSGERLLFVFNSANHDPEIFPQPEEFQCPRDRNSHLAFGFGVHRCVGEHLALLQMRIIAEEVLRLVPDYRLDSEHPEWAPGRQFRGLARLPVTFPSRMRSTRGR